MKALRIVFDGLGILVFVALLVFVVRNRPLRTSIDLYVRSFQDVPVSALVLGSLLAGAILALFFAIPEWVRLRAKIRELRGGGA